MGMLKCVLLFGDSMVSPFGFWEGRKSLLVLVTDLARLSSNERNILKSKNMIAMNQDSLGKAAALANGDVVVLLFSKTPTPRNISVDVTLLDDLSTGDELSVKDLWTREAWSSDGRNSVKDVWDSRIPRVSIA